MVILLHSSPGEILICPNKFVFLFTNTNTPTSGSHSCRSYFRWSVLVTSHYVSDVPLYAKGKYLIKWILLPLNSLQNNASSQNIHLPRGVWRLFSKAWYKYLITWEDRTVTLSSGVKDQPTRKLYWTQHLRSWTHYGPNEQRLAGRWASKKKAFYCTY